MFAKIQKKYMAKMIFWAIVCWGIAIALIVWNADDAFLVMKVRTEEPVNLNSLTASQIQEGLFVEGEITAPMDYYAYWQEDNKTTVREFLIAVGEQEYMGLSSSGDTMLALNDNMQILWDAMDKDDSSLLKGIEPVKVRGVIRKLSGKSLSYFEEYIQSANLSEEQKALFLDYVLMEGEYGDASLSSLIIYGIFALILILVGINCIVGGVKHRNIQDLKKYCEEQGDLEYGLFQMEQFYESGITEQGLRLSDEFFLMIAGTNVYFAPTTEVLWIYPHITKHSVNFIPTGKTYAIKVKKADGREFMISIKNKRAMEGMMDYISSRTPYIILGYDKDIEQIYLRRRSEMIQVVEQRRREHLGVMAQPAGQPQPYAEQPQPYAEQPQPYAEQPQPYAGQPQPYAEQLQPYAGQPQPYPEQQPYPYPEQPQSYPAEQQSYPYPEQPYSTEQSYPTGQEDKYL